MSIREVLPFAELDWRIEAPPLWLEPKEPDWAFEAPSGTSAALLLVDEQQHVPSQSISNRIVRCLLTSAGITAFRRVEIAFDPRTRRLCLHELVVWRKDASGMWQPTPATDSVDFAVKTQGRQTGRVSLTAELDWLQEGDAIDLSWTLQPLESAPELPFSTFHGFVWNVPCGVTHFTIYTDNATPFRHQLHCPEGIRKPEHTSTPGRHHWRQVRPPVTRIEPNAPPGVWNFPVLEASCWESWGEVAAYTHEFWAAALADSSGSIADAAARYATGPDLTASATEIIRFVQDQIADAEDDSGPAGMLFPNKPSTVLQHSSGDPKDKAVLLTALLRQIGVDASPVLVNPDWQETLASLLPCSTVFNHVIVAFVANGLRHYVDPSESSQTGGFPAWVQPSYGLGLEVSPFASELLPLPPAPAAELILSETFHLDAKRAQGSVEQVLRGTHWLADEIRESVARDGRTPFIEAHIAALESQFPELTADPAVVTLREDPASAAIEMRGRYDLPGWGTSGAGAAQDFVYRANGLLLAVEWTESPEERTVARALRHPMRVQHLVKVEGAFIRPGKPEQTVVDGPAFRYRREVTWQQGVVTFDHIWETTAARVEASEWAKYCRAAGQIFEQLEVSVPLKPARTSGLNVRSAVLFSLAALGILGGIGIGAKLLSSREALVAGAPTPEVQKEVQKALEAASQGDLTSAQPLLEKQQEKFKADPAFQFVRAEVALRTGQLDKAREALEQAKSLDPSNVNGEVLTAILHRAEGKETSAKEMLTQAAERNPNDPRPMRELALTLAQQDDPQGALNAWARVLELSPGDADALRQYAVLLWQNGQQSQADSIMSQALAAQTTPNAALEAAAGDYYTLTGRRAEALNRLEKAASLDPGDRTRDFALASGHLRMGRPQEASDLATKLTADYPTDVRAWQVMAVAKSILGDQPGAEKAYREWMRLAPQDPKGPANFGYFLHQTGRQEEAKTFLAESSAKFPKEGMIWLNYAAVLDALGETQSATEARQRASSLLTNEEKQLLIR